MPLAPIDDEHSLYYEDSGPINERYLTLVMLHASGFHCGIFRRMFPFAARNGLRLVIVNAREYPRSSRLTSYDIGLIQRGNTAMRTEFFRLRSLDILYFLDWFVRTHKIPSTESSARGQQGGLVVVGWSSGFTSIVGLLALAGTIVDQVPKDVIHNLKSYLRSICAYDVPRYFYGLPVTVDSLPSVCARSTSYVPPSEVSDRRGPFRQISDFSSMMATNLVNPLTDETQFITSMSPIDRQKTTYIHGVQRVDRWIDTAPQDVYSGLMAQICDNRNASVWPSCTMHVIWCENGWREVADGVQGLRRCWPVVKSNGEGRKLVTTSFPQAGHLFHWDDPARACHLFAAAFS